MTAARIGDRVRLRLAGRRGTLTALGTLLLAGITLRVLLVAAWRPGFLGYPDSAIYLDAARGTFSPGSDPRLPHTVFFDKMRPAGYPLFLRAVHALDPHLSFATVVQHGLGVAAALLLYLTVRRADVPSWVGLVPAGCILLGGTEIFVEHGALTESLYIVLQAGALYAAVRSLDSVDPGWAALSGFLIGAAGGVRFLGLVLVPILALWLVLARRGSIGSRVLHAAALVAASGLVIGGYLYAQHQKTGFTGLTRSGAWNLYGRVAPFADCSKFTPPAGTEVLCETRPPSERPGPDYYIFISSPARTAFGGPDWGEDRLATPADNAKIAAFARAVILHQPLDYVRTVAHDLVRYVFPGLIEPRLDDGLTSGQLITQLQDPAYTQAAIDIHARPYFETGGVPAKHSGLMGALEAYERWTRFDGLFMLALLGLTAAGPFAARGRAREVAALFSVLAVMLLVTPVATIFWDARLGVPAYGVLGGSAALGAWALAARLRNQRTSS